METSDQLKQSASNEQEDGQPAFFLLHAVEGSAALTELGANRATEVQELFAQYQPSADLEYPSPRSIVERQGPTPPISERVEAVQPSGMRPGAITGEHVSSDGPASPFRFLGSLAGVSCGFLALSVMLAGAAIADQNWALLAGAASLLVFSAFVLMAVVRASRSADSRLERPDSQRPAIWGLEDGGGWKDALRIGVRTSGLGLLVEPVNRDSSRQQEPKGH